MKELDSVGEFEPQSITFSWASLATQAGSGTVYDAVKGGLAALRQSGSFTAAQCLINNTPATSINDAAFSPAGDGLWYLIRGQNVCASGTYGNSTLTPDPRDLLDQGPFPCP